MGYHVTTVTPANMAPSAQAALPSMMILPAVCVHALHAVRIGLGEGLGGEIVARLRRAPVQVGGLGLALAELLHQRLVDLLHFDGEQLRHHAVVNHVADQLAQLGFGADRRHQLVEGHRDRSADRSRSSLSLSGSS